jgi:ribonuclease J
MVKINILQGKNEVGGNCIVVADGANKVFFDQGIRFSRFKKFYKGNITPSGFSEMQKLKIIPNIQEPSEIYITHYHLDHLGLLHALQPGSTVYVPDKDIFNKFSDFYKSSNTWTTYVPPHPSIDIKEPSPSGNVIPLQNEHSAYPAVSYLYHGSENILYTGDLRISSPLELVSPDAHKKLHESTLLDKYSQEGYSTDYLIIEGTNFSSPVSPLRPHHFVEDLQSIFMNHEDSLVFVSIDYLDAEAILSLITLSRTYERIPVVTGKRLTEMTKVWLDKAKLNEEVRQLYEKDVSPEFPIVSDEELKAEPKQFLVLISKGESIDLARKLELRKGSVLISLSAEARGENEEDESAEENWYKLLGFIIYKLRISGHYYPNELKEILNVIRPKKKVIPVHTESPYTMCELVRSLGYNCGYPSH